MALLWGAFSYWVAANVSQRGTLPITVQLRRPISSGLTRALPPEVLQLFMLLVALLALVAGVWFIAIGLGEFITMIRDWRAVDAYQEKERAAQARRQARQARPANPPARRTVSPTRKAAPPKATQ